MQIIHTHHKTPEELRNEKATEGGRKLAADASDKPTEIAVTSILFDVEDYDKSLPEQANSLIE